MFADSIRRGKVVGRGVCIIDNSVFVGSPKNEGEVTDDGTVAVFDLTVSGEYAWKNIASERLMKPIKIRIEE